LTRAGNAFMIERINLLFSTRVLLPDKMIKTIHMKKIAMVLMVPVFLIACSNDKPKQQTQQSGQTSNVPKTETGNPVYDPNRGVGKFTNIEIKPTLDGAMATTGEKAYGVKCSSCHKLTAEKLVGPGWKEVTSRFTAAWIMNFMTNTDEMLSKDPRAQAQLELCLVRMPNQNLSDEEARALYEYMRKNDGIK
jgi:mono/diheme cytochrome c family protein